MCAAGLGEQREGVGWVCVLAAGTAPAVLLVVASVTKMHLLQIFKRPVSNMTRKEYQCGLPITFNACMIAGGPCRERGTMQLFGSWPRHKSGCMAPETP